MFFPIIIVSILSSNYASNCAGNFFRNQQLTSIDLLSDKIQKVGADYVKTAL